MDFFGDTIQLITAYRTSRLDIAPICNKNPESGKYEAISTCPSFSLLQEPEEQGLV